jgi:uncharacterized protein with HEPN domain
VSKDNIVYLKHILDSINQIEIFIENLTYEKYHDLPWKSIADMRDKLIHGYMGVDLKDVWKTAIEDIPNLKINITKILNEIEIKK